jgi:hypothetical protein
MTSLTPFISRDDLGDYLGRDVSTDDGALAAIDAACDMVRTITEQDFNAVTGGTAVMDGTGTDTLVLKRLPVTRVRSVTIGGTVNKGTITGGTAITSWKVREDGVLMRTAGAATGDPSYSGETLPLRWPKGRQNIKVVYDSGYGTAVLPRDIRMVALQIAARLTVQGVSVYETVGDVSMRYAGPATDFTAGEKMILRKYKR